MSLTKKVAFNSGAMITGKVVITLIALVSVKLLTSVLGPSGYGEYAAALNYVALFGTLADFGFYWILAKELTKAKGDQNKTDFITGNIIALRSLFALVILGCAVTAIYLIPVGTFAILTPTLKLGILVVAIATFWQSLNMTFIAIFQVQYRMDRPVLAEIIGRSASLLLLIPFLMWHLNIVWLLSAMVWGAVINYFVNLYFARHYTKPRLNFDINYWGTIFKESYVLGIISVFGLIYYKIDSVILSVFKSSIEVGIYSAPYKVIEIVNYIPSIFTGIVFIALVEAWNSDRERFVVLVRRSFEVMFILSMPIVIGGIILARPIMNFITSSDYALASTYSAHIMGQTYAIDGAFVLRLLLLAVWFDFFGNVFGRSIIAISKSYKLLIANFIAVAFNIGLNIYLIPHWSYFGAALTTIMTEALVLGVQLIILHKYINFRLPFNIMLRTGLATVIMAAILYPLRHSNALIGATVGVLVYGISAWKVGAISPQTLKLILRKEV